MESLSLALILKAKPKNKYFFHNHRKEILLLKLRGFNIADTYDFLCHNTDVVLPSTSSLYKYLSKYPFTEKEKEDGMDTINNGISDNEE